MPKCYLFLADVHLNVETPEKTARFINFLTCQKPRPDILYILGDLFDLWIGPKHLKRPDYYEVIQTLRKMVKSGTKINFIYGNRDFQVGHRFSRFTGVEVLGDKTVISLAGKKILLTHGDLLCTRDYGYTSLRRIARSSLVKSIYQALPGDVAYHIGKWLKDLSAKMVARKPEADRDIVMKAVYSLFNKGYDIIICGHIHRPQEIHIKSGPHKGKMLLVLGGWGKEGSFIEYQETEGVFRLHPR